MQVKRFVADDMRSAMRQVKEEIGADAVILSNRVVDGKVEILAARDFDESLINEALDQSLIKSKPDGAAAHYERRAAEREQVQRELQQAHAYQQVHQQEAQLTLDEQNLSPANTALKPHQAAGLSQHKQTGRVTDSDSSEAPLGTSVMQMRDELKSLRAMIENQQIAIVV